MTITPELQSIVNKLADNDQSLTRLDLRNQNIGAKEIKILADALRKNLNLEHLQISVKADDAASIAALENMLRENLGLMNLEIKGAKATALIEASLQQNRTANDISEIFISYLRNPENEMPAFTIEELDFILDPEHPENSVFAAIKFFHAMDKNNLSAEPVRLNDGFLEVANFLDIAAKGAFAVEQFLLSEPKNLSPEDKKMQESYLKNLIKDPQFLLDQTADWEQDAIKRSGFEIVENNSSSEKIEEII